MNAESFGHAKLEREVPKTETLALRLLRMRAISDPGTESTLQSLIAEIYKEGASQDGKPSLGQVSNRVRGKILSEMNNQPDMSAYALVNLAKRAVKEASRSASAPS